MMRLNAGLRTMSVGISIGLRISEGKKKEVRQLPSALRKLQQRGVRALYYPRY